MDRVSNSPAWAAAAPESSAHRLREMLARHDRALAMYTGEALYHYQVDYTCQLLDVVDEVTDPVTAGRVTDGIYERLTGDGVSEAARRVREARAEYERLVRSRVPRPMPPR